MLLDPGLSTKTYKKQLKQNKTKQKNKNKQTTTTATTKKNKRRRGRNLSAPNPDGEHSLDRSGKSPPWERFGPQAILEQPLYV